MTGTRPAEILRHLEPPGPDDCALVNRFAGQNDQAAFAELVRRHGPLVWAACLRVAGHRQDAEDAFQAVFLVLVRKCAAIRDLDLLGNWLYGVAVRVAMKARRTVARRRAREVQVPAMPDPPSPAVEAAPDLAPVLDEELAALPAWYRDAVVLCDIRGASREEAARLLGIPEGTLSSRLANGRKKLAARLAKRGVALSAAAVHGALAGAARAAVPPEVLARACAVANGTPIPAPVTRLASGDVTMTTKLFLGVAGAALAAVGAVFATQPDVPKPGDPPRAALAATADPGAQQPGPEAKAEKAAYGTPRMRGARDFDLVEVRSVVWSPDGAVFALDGQIKNERGDLVGHAVQLASLDPKDDRLDLRQPIGASSRLVALGGGAKEVVTEQRERELLSGFHRLVYLPVNLKPKAAGAGAVPRTVDLDAGDTHGYAFAPDGKTFRTLAFTMAAGGGLRKITVTSVDATTGKTLKTLLTAEGEIDGWGLSRSGEKLAVVTAAGDVMVSDVDAGKLLWSKEKQIGQGHGLSRGRSTLAVAFSPDGTHLVVGGQRVRPTVFEAASGTALPPLEDVEYADTYLAPACLSRDGRLVVLHGQHWLARSTKGGGFGGGNPREQSVWSTGPAFLGVWDTATGKLLRQWNQIPSTVAFHPTRPVLAIVEPNGGNRTRVGLWDFGAEVEKK
jgi:RNA polymerase sigma factor (sigma-70 family)